MLVSYCMIIIRLLDLVKKKKMIYRFGKIVNFQNSYLNVLIFIRLDTKDTGEWRINNKLREEN